MTGSAGLAGGIGTAGSAGLAAVPGRREMPEQQALPDIGNAAARNRKSRAMSTLEARLRRAGRQGMSI